MKYMGRVNISSPKGLNHLFNFYYRSDPLFHELNRFQILLTIEKGYYLDKNFNFAC